MLVTSGCREWTISPCAGTPFKTPCVGPCTVDAEPGGPTCTHVTMPLAVVIQDQQGKRLSQPIQSLSTNRPRRDMLSIRQCPCTKESGSDLNPDFSQLLLAWRSSSCRTGWAMVSSFKSCRIGVRHVLYYVWCFAIIFWSRPPLVWTRQAGPLLRVSVTTIGPVSVSPEAGPAPA